MMLTIAAAKVEGGGSQGKITQASKSLLLAMDHCAVGAALPTYAFRAGRSLDSR